jgi:acyl carrier protein
MGRDELTDNDIKANVRAFLANQLLPLSRVKDFDDSDSFLEKGVLDSTGVLELVGYLESEYKIRIETDELVPDNLDSLEKLALFVSKKQSKFG